MAFSAVSVRRGVLADLVPGSVVRDVALIAAGAGLTGLAAQVSVHIPSITPVPFTLQTLAVLIAGASLGSVRGTLSMLLYVAAGSAGVPWFANATHGWGYAPSFGYIIGFIAAAAIVGELARRGNDRALTSSLGVMVIGDAVLLAVGTLWLAADLHLGAAKAISLGVTPFLIGEAIKIAVASAVFPATWKLLRR